MDNFDQNRLVNVVEFPDCKDYWGKKIEVGDLVEIKSPPVIYGKVIRITASSQFNEARMVQVEIAPKLRTMMVVNHGVTLKSKAIK